MQAVQQFSKFGECERRCQRRPNGKGGTFRRVGNPRWETTDGAVGQLAEDVFPFWEFHPPFKAKALTM
jgi:hypothetical protein